MEFENLEAVMEELEALASIYGNDWRVENPVSRCYTIRISNEADVSARFEICLPPGYPSQRAPTYKLHCCCLSAEDMKLIESNLSEIYEEHTGEPIIYLWIEYVREILQSKELKESDCMEMKTSATEPEKEGIEEADSEAAVSSLRELKPTERFCRETGFTEVGLRDKGVVCPEIHHGDFLHDRKSHFQAHLARVTDIRQVPLVMQKLKENRKVAEATHNIQAYRIQLANGSVAEDCVDDGETQAGSRMLHLLHMAEAMNVFVIVTRWYGGIHLGPDRFKHINNLTRNILLEHKFIQMKEPRKKKH